MAVTHQMMQQIKTVNSYRHRHFRVNTLQDPVNQRLLRAVVRFAEQLERLGYSVRAYSDLAIQSLADTSLSKREKIAIGFEDLCEWTKILSSNNLQENEVSLLMRALDKHGFEADEEFLRVIGKDEIIEFYNENMIQIYRSFNFYKITGYSLLDISLREWYVLWDRSKQSFESISAEVNESLVTHIPVKQFKTKAHVIRETFNASQSSQFQERAAYLTPIRLGSFRFLKIEKRRIAFEKRFYLHFKRRGARCRKRG